MAEREAARCPQKPVACLKRIPRLGTASVAKFVYCVHRFCSMVLQGFRSSESQLYTGSRKKACGWAAMGSRRKPRRRSRRAQPSSRSPKRRSFHCGPSTPRGHLNLFEDPREVASSSAALGGSSSCTTAQAKTKASGGRDRREKREKAETSRSRAIDEGHAARREEPKPTRGHKLKGIPL